MHRTWWPEVGTIIVTGPYYFNKDTVNSQAPYIQVIMNPTIPVLVALDQHQPNFGTLLLSFHDWIHLPNPPTSMVGLHCLLWHQRSHNLDRPCPWFPSSFSPFHPGLGSAFSIYPALYTILSINPELASVTVVSRGQSHWCHTHRRLSHWWNCDKIPDLMKIFLPILSLISLWSQQNFAHTKTAVLSWYVQNFILIRGLYFELQWWEFPFNSEFNANITSGMYHRVGHPPTPTTDSSQHPINYTVPLAGIDIEKHLPYCTICLEQRANYTLTSVGY